MSDTNNNEKISTYDATVTMVHCWSAPRSRSTALMYSFEARRRCSTNICIAMDEPLYREWLMDKGESVIRPYTQNMIQGIPPEDETTQNAFKWKREVVSSLQERIEIALREELETKHNVNKNNIVKDGIVFLKHMAKHSYLYDFDHPLSNVSIALKDGTIYKIQLVHCHLLLIRDPVAVLSSWNHSSNVHNNDVTPDEVGIIPLLSIYSKVTSLVNTTTTTTSNNNNSDNNSIVIVDSDELVSDPQTVLQTLCEEELHIPFMEEMLTWESGPHDCDGPWAKWWYTNVHTSTGWTIPSSSSTSHDYPTSYENINKDEAESSTTTAKKYRTLDPQLMTALRASLPAYNFLQSFTRSHQKRSIHQTQVTYEDPRNEHLLAWIGPPKAYAKGGGRLVPREMACISPWDSSVQGGDAVWEGIRIYDGKIFHLERHLRRLFHSAKALGYDYIHTKEEVIEAIFQTLAANGMRDGAHMRLTLTRGEKITSSMNPNFNLYGTTLIILAEWKPTVGGVTTYDNAKGIALISSSQRRNAPSCVDSKIHHNNMINNILPKIQANLANVGDALMLDPEGFVSETNATNIFMVNDDGVLLTPSADYCLPGITRETIINLCQTELQDEIPVQVRRISLMEFYNAKEVFTTGTMGELTPVIQIDGRTIGDDGRIGPITSRLQQIYKTLPNRPGWSTPIPPFS